MSATYNRSRIMQAAHATAKRRIASVGGSYREWFGKALRVEWKRAKEAKERREQNVGLRRVRPARQRRSIERARFCISSPWSRLRVEVKVGGFQWRAIFLITNWRFADDVHFRCK